MCYVPGLYISFFPMVRNDIVNFCSVFLDERVLVRDVEHTSGIGEIIFFFIILIYLNEHNYLYSIIQQLLKFILIYNLNLNLRLFIFIYELDRFDRCLELTFIFHGFLFYFRSSTILVESPSTTELNNFFSLFCTTSSRRLCVLDYGEFPNVSKNCICCVVGPRSSKSSHGDSHVKYF